MSRKAAIAVALAFLVASSGYAAASTRAEPPKLPNSQSASIVERTAGYIPWSEVGPGWVLAQWNRDPATSPGQHYPPGYIPNPPQYLYLVSPQGARYFIKKGADNMGLDAWSGDGQRAMLLSYSSSRIRIVDLATGTTIATFKARNGVNGPVAFSRPNGLAVLISSGYDVKSVLRRYSLSGTLEQAYPHAFTHVGVFDGFFLSSPDGTHIVLGTSKGIAVVNNGGTVAGQYSAAHASTCKPMRWWAPGVVLAACSWKQYFGTRLYEFHLQTGKVGVLTAPAGPHNGSARDAWPVGGRIYVETGGPAQCSGYFGRLEPNHTVRAVSVPGVTKGRVAFPIGADGASLALFKSLSCGGDISVLWFDVVSNTSTTVIGPPIMGGSVGAAVLYPEPMG